jgi:antitoxin CcdA
VDAAPGPPVAEALRRKWLDENAQAFAEQAEWHERHGHPLARILASPGKAIWKP